VVPVQLSVTGHHDKANFIFSIADLLRGTYRPHEYGQVILPLCVLRRLDCVLEPTKVAVVEAAKTLQIENKDPILRRIAKQTFYNTSPLDFRKLLDDPGHIAGNVSAYIAGFSPMAFETFDRFGFERQIERLESHDLLFLVFRRFAGIDLHPDKVSNTDMGYIFEELIRRFSEQSNEAAGEHFTPREVVRLMVDLLFIEDDPLLREKGIIRSMYDPACGTGGMLSVAQEYLRELNPSARLEAFGQELNDESWAICRSDMMIKGQNPENIIVGNSFTKDGHGGREFDYFLSNPPFGVEWKKDAAFIKSEANKADGGRFGAGLPRVSDGSFLFLQHMISKWKPVDRGGSRLAIVLNGSPLVNGDAGSGESNIRRWLIENDWVEAIIALPDQLFYNTDIFTFIWILTNRKRANRVGKIQLIDGSDLYTRLRRNLGKKRNEISSDQLQEIIGIYGEFEDGPKCKVFPNQALGYQRVTVQRPLRVAYAVTPEGLESIRGLSKLGPHATKVADMLSAKFDERRTPQAAASQLVASVLDDARIKSSPTLIGRILQCLAVHDPNAPPVLGAQGWPVADPSLRDTEDIPLGVKIDEYLAREVSPFRPDAWAEVAKVKIGYEIPFNFHFFTPPPVRPLAEIDRGIDTLESEILKLLSEVR
jgi:type I restriction enzyme M protein